METKFRPIPLTIIDFLAIFLPGLVWLLLIIISIQFCQDGYLIASPIIILKNFFSSITESGFYFPTIILISASLITGYTLQPIAMNITACLSKPLFRFHKNTKNIWKSLKFPYNKLHEETLYYKRIKELLRRQMDISTDELPGKQPFSSAKRYLRIMAPTLWEEGERLEAEVRMIAALFLAALYSSILSLVILAFIILGFFPNSNKLSILILAIISIFSALILAENFNYFRNREVKYTYLNTLVAFSCCQSSNKSTHKRESERMYQ